MDQPASLAKLQLTWLQIRFRWGVKHKSRPVVPLVPGSQSLLNWLLAASPEHMNRIRRFYPPSQNKFREHQDSMLFRCQNHTTHTALICFAPTIPSKVASHRNKAAPSIALLDRSVRSHMQDAVSRCTIYRLLINQAQHPRVRNPGLRTQNLYI